MKNKFNVGEKVVFVAYNEAHNHWEISNDIIESVLFDKDGISYYTEHGGCELKEENLHTKEEAIEFLKGVLHD